MAMPPASSFKILKVLSQHRRHLHITGVNSAPAVTGSQKAGSIWLTKTTTDLAAECRRRKFIPFGTKDELMERIAAHDTLQSRAISIALKRINSGPKQVQGAIAVSHFNTLRAQKAVGDSSTVDFIFLPTNLDHSLHDETFNMRVPILPDSFHIGSIQTVHTETAPVMRPEIYSVSGSPDIAGPSPMSEVLDNTAIDIDPFSLTETVTRAAHKVVSGEQEVSSVKAFLGGFVEDLLGPAKSTSLA